MSIINIHLKRIYEKRGGKVPAKISVSKKSRAKLPTGFVYNGANIIHRYYGKDLPSFGIFSGDLLTIAPRKSLLHIRKNSLVAVQLQDGSTRICSLTYGGFECCLHDGNGNDFKFVRTSYITLIGEVLRGENG